MAIPAIIPIFIYSGNIFPTRHLNLPNCQYSSVGTSFVNIRPGSAKSHDNSITIKHYNYDQTIGRQSGYRA